MDRCLLITCIVSLEFRGIVGIGCPVHNCGGGFDPWPGCPNTLFGCGRQGLIALTFDDGITAATGALSEKLYAAGIKATFFINGDVGANRTWNAMRTLYQHGHQVSSHTRSHCNMVGGWVGEPCDSVGGWRTDLDNLVADVRANGQQIRGAPNQGGWYYVRPPYLDVDHATAKEIGVAGYRVAWATDSADDWNGDNEPSKSCLLDIVNHSSASDSHVMLQHDWAAGWQISADWWLDLKARADANGWQFVTIDECDALWRTSNQAPRARFGNRWRYRRDHKVSLKQGDQHD